MIASNDSNDALFRMYRAAMRYGDARERDARNVASSGWWRMGWFRAMSDAMPYDARVGRMLSRRTKGHFRNLSAKLAQLEPTNV